MDKDMTYAKAAQRLNDIIKQIESEQLDIDTLTDTLKEAKQLIEFCKQRLYTIEQDVKEILGEEE